MWAGDGPSGSVHGAASPVIGMRRCWSAWSWWGGVCSAALGVSLAFAAEPAAPQAGNLPFTLADVTLGEHVSGEDVTRGDLEHHVVLLAFWTQARKAGEAGMPLLEQAHRSLGPAGLRVVGLHVERGAVPEVRRAALELGLTFPVFDGGAVKGFDPEEPPFALLFDHGGRCVAQGGLAEMAARAVAAVNAAPPVVLAGRRLEKLTAFERMLRDEAKFGVVLRKAESLTADDDGTLAEEATYLSERLRAHGEALLAKAEALKPNDPLEAATLLHRAATAYRGDAIGRRAVDCQREWKRDKAFSDGLQAASLAAELEALRGQALARPPGGRSQPGGSPAVAGIKAAAAIPPPLKAQMAQIAAMVLQLSPGSKYAVRAEQIALELGLHPSAGP